MVTAPRSAAAIDRRCCSGFHEYMVAASSFVTVVETISRCAPALTLASVEVDERARVVTIGTSLPGKLIGHHGSTAQELRRALSAVLDWPELKLSIAEIAERPGQEPPGAGVREPRRPAPTAPATSVSLPLC